MRVLLTTDTVGGVWTYTRELTEGLLSLTDTPWPSSASAAFQILSNNSGPRESLASTATAFTTTRLMLRWNGCPRITWPTSMAPRFSSVSLPTSRRPSFHTNQFCFGRLDLSIPTLVAAHSDVLSWADACIPDGLPPSPWLTKYQDLVQQGLNAADVIVAPTYWMLNALAARVSLPSRQRVIANGRTLRLPQPAPTRLPQAVSAGRLWDPAKNVAMLQQVRACPVFIAGAGLVPDEHSSGTATLLGNLPEADLLHLFRSSRVYIAASLYEPFGLAPLEAALCGCAIVANNIPSLREVWGNAALYFASLAELEQHLLTLTRHDDIFLRQQHLSTERARALTAASMTVNYLALYDELCCSPQLSSATTERSTLTHVH